MDCLGILAPLAIGAAFLRNNFNVLKTNGRWLQIHFYLSGLVALFTLLGFILAVVATKKEDGDTLQFNKDVHHKAGLAIFILVFIQAFAGYVRPSPLPPPSSSSPNNVITNSKSSSDRDIPNKTNTTFVEDDVEELSYQQKQQAYNASATNNEEVVYSEKSTTAPSITSKKSYLRLFWECGHRLLGITLLLLAVYNCQTGIILQSENYAQDDKETLTNIFWSITGSITVIIFLLRFAVRI
jgi:cytochrome b561